MALLRSVAGISTWAIRFTQGLLFKWFLPSQNAQNATVIPENKGSVVELSRAHFSGTDRAQLPLLPEVVDDYVGPDDLVRFIEAFADYLILMGAGFHHVTAKTTGRLGHDLSDLLKLHIYGYVNRVRSSRRGAETRRNIEVIRLFTGRRWRCWRNGRSRLNLTLGR
jgi:hypothetical protein